MKKVKVTVKGGERKLCSILYQPDNGSGFDFTKTTVLNSIILEHGNVEVKDETENSFTFKPVIYDDWRTVKFEEA